MADTDDPPAAGDDAPPFAAPVANDGIAVESFENFLDDAPVVLAFFPAAFSGTCTAELCTFRDELAAFEDVGGTVLGVSTDLPWALAAFREREGLPFGLVADNDASVCAAYGVRTHYEPYDIPAVARRSVFVVDGDGTVTYRWLAAEPGQEPDYDEVAAAVADAV